VSYYAFLEYHAVTFYGVPLPVGAVAAFVYWWAADVQCSYAVGTVVREEANGSHCIACIENQHATD
jgi:hypothetical protein